MTRPDLEDRIFGRGRWSRSENYSYKWIDEGTANKIVQEHIRENWETIRTSLARTGRYSETWDTGRKVGEGYYNKNVGTALPKVPIFHTTSSVTLTILLDQNGNPYIVTTYPRGGFQ